jgi:hypothetical protein
MTSRRRIIVFLLVSLISILSVSCTARAGESISLVSFTRNYVEVSIDLERNAEGYIFLAGTFTPPKGYHLYSKDIPLHGVDGLGRPTLLALTEDSQSKAAGDLTESVRAQEPDFGPNELWVYPLGPVTLRLPIELPPGHTWISDEISVTFMACSASQCKPPVVGEIVSIRVPGADIAKKK